MSDSLTIWVELSASPLFGITLTLLAYQGGCWVFAKSGHKAWLNPVPIAIALVALFLWLTKLPYARYFEGAKFIHFLLGPATVALAIPLFTYWSRMRQMTFPLIAALLSGSATASLSAMGIAKWLGASKETIYSLAPKAITTPIAMGVSEKIGGLPSLTAVFVVFTGVLGAVFFRSFLRLLKIENHTIQGFALGLNCHGLGTARAFMFSEEMGAFSALAMGLNGLITAFFLPIILSIV